MSTFYDDSIMSKQRRTQHVPGGIEEVQMPVMVEQYMGGVDKSDQLLSYQGFSHHTGNGGDEHFSPC